MEPIISPWLIYWISVLSNLNNLAHTISCISAVLILALIPAYFCIDISEDTKDKVIRILKISIIVFVISGLLSVLIPSKNDMIGMLVLSYITPDNIDLVQDNMVEFVKRIMDIIQSNSN
jgi:hypothetical protein